MEISESAWAKAKEIASKIYASYLTSHDPNADAELIARAIDQERR